MTAQDILNRMVEKSDYDSILSFLMIDCHLSETEADLIIEAIENLTGGRFED